MNDEFARRLEAVEMHLTHLERQVEQLNEVLVEQNGLTAKLKKEVQRQSAVLQTMELERIKANNPRPPHSAG